MKKIIYILTLVLLVGSCGFVEKYENKLAQWIGKSEDALLEAWGAPDLVYQGEKNTKHLTYISNKTKKADSFVGHYFSSTSILEKECRTTFAIVDKRVASWSHRGSNCIAY